MDMTKAFDMVEWVELFGTLILRKVNFMVLRLMLFIYENQSCSVKWSNERSSWFRVSNGVRQGAVSSAILFAVYIDNLLLLLKNSRIGCHIHGVFLGAFIFADDILLLSASRAGLQSLVNTCQEFASNKNLKFGTDPNPTKSKTKCIVFSKKPKDMSKLAPVVLDGRNLPWVRKVNHLGSILESDCSMKSDIVSKKGQFVGRMNSLLQEFHFLDSSTMIKLVTSYALTFYGSALWNLQSKECEKLYNSWNVAIRNILHLDRKTHRYLIEPLSGLFHLKTLLMARYVRFFKSLINSPKFEVRFLARLFQNDKRTVLGKTLQFLIRSCKLKDSEDLSPQLVKRSLEFAATPEGYQWTAPLARELLELRNSELEVDGFAAEELEEMLTFACTI